MSPLLKQALLDLFRSLQGDDWRDELLNRRYQTVIQALEVEGRRKVKVIKRKRSRKGTP